MDVANASGDAGRARGALRPVAAAPAARPGRPRPAPVATACCCIRRRCPSRAATRLKALTETTDGFEIAERDLQLRGPGDFFGTRQSGLPTLRVGDLLRDHQLMEEARREAVAALDDPGADGGAGGVRQRELGAEVWVGGGWVRSCQFPSSKLPTSKAFPTPNFRSELPTRRTDRYHLASWQLGVPWRLGVGSLGFDRLRVIAGTLKGRRLDTPDWDGLRPTSDKLRETLFNVLAPRIGGGAGARRLCRDGRGRASRR